jgi:hypothetical protein
LRQVGDGNEGNTAMNVTKRAMCAGLAATALLAWTGPPVQATDAPAMLTITAGEHVAALSAADVAALPQHEIRTANEFIDGVGVFTGPLARVALADAMAAAPGATEAVMVALNDYEVAIPLSDFLDYDVVLATAMNGKPLTRRDKGPIWVMYPIDDHNELRQSIYDNRLIWQLKTIVLR